MITFVLVFIRYLICGIARWMNCCFYELCLGRLKCDGRVQVICLERCISLLILIYNIAFYLFVFCTLIPEAAGGEEPEDGTETPIGDGISSVPSGLETPDTIDLRKARKDTVASEPDDPNRQLYTVLEQTAAKVGGAAYLFSAYFI